MCWSITTDPLATDTEVTGPVESGSVCRFDRRDTDFTATLSDVHPDGRAIHICEGIRGVTFRESLEHPSLIEPGQVYRYRHQLVGNEPRVRRRAIASALEVIQQQLSALRPEPEHRFAAGNKCGDACCAADDLS